MVYNAEYYVHETDKAALKTLKAIPGFHQVMRTFMKVWNERQYRILNMSSRVRLSETQMAKYYDLLPPICEKLGIEVPDMYLELDVVPNAYTAGDTNPFVVLTSGLFETIPEALIPTIIAHECGHIACHHVLYSTIGGMLLDGAFSALQRFVPYGGALSIPLEAAFFHWMRCSELSADRAAILCDGGPEKMSEVCLRLAGCDKDIDGRVSKQEFLAQARAYRDMVRDSKWDRTLEFMILRRIDHPLMAVRALECEEWAKTDQFRRILSGTYRAETTETIAELTSMDADEAEPDKKARPRIGFPGFGKKPRDAAPEGGPEPSAADEIRRYKALLDDGIITEEEFEAKKKQLLGI